MSKSKTVTVQCSNCGKHEEVAPTYDKGDELFGLGYRAVGDAVYCPACVATWASRNGGKSFEEAHINTYTAFNRWWVNKAVEK